MLRVTEPQYLWLLLLLPLVWFLAGRLKLLPTARRWTIVALRTALILCLVFALARLEFKKHSKDLAVFFLIDLSDSVPADRQQQAIDLLRPLTKPMAKEDEAGVIVFGDRPSLETSPAKQFEFEGRILSEVDGERSDISGAMRLAMAAFPVDRMRRMVLLSDGNENKGSALEAARYAQSNGIPVDVIPLRYDAQNDLRIDKVVVPQRTSKDSPFDIKVFAEAREDTEAKLRVFEDGQLILEETVQLRAGRNPPLVIPRRLTEGGFHSYTASIEAPGDLRPQNNRANAFTYLRAEPHVLLVEGSEREAARYLVGALQAESIRVTLGGVEAIPLSLEEMQRYDAVIFSNVGAGSLSHEQMRLVERGIHDLGVGFVMIGGENSFGAGGWIDTPIELALPVSMDVKQKKVLPNGALMLVLHTCEIPSGNAWAREIAIASLNVLSSQDQFGIVYFGAPLGGGGGGYGGWGDHFAWKPGIKPTGDKKEMRTAIKSIQPLDMQDFDPGMKKAADALVEVKAQTKHIVVISDGDPAPPSESVVKTIRDNGITVSAVAIAPHRGMTVDTLKKMAYWGSGNFYYPQNPAELPRIFTKEATVVRRSMIYETPFFPVEDSPSEMLLGISGYPQLQGYVVTSMKDLATQVLATDKDDPLLANWRYGLGKTVAFTSDAKNKWAADWVQWGRFAKFWSQIVRWTLRETNNANFQVNTELRGGTGYVTIDALTDAGDFRNFLDFDAKVIGPDFEPMELDVRQVAPGRYEGTFPAGKVGTYMLSMQTDDQKNSENPEFLTGGVALSYSPEYQTSRSNDELLSEIAAASGGLLVADPQSYNPFNRNLESTSRPFPLWPALLLGALVLLPFDIFVRRVYLSLSEMAGWMREKILGVLPQKSVEEQDARMANLQAAKARAQRTAEDDEADAQRKEFRERIAERAASGKSDGNLFATPDNPGRVETRSAGKQTVSADNQPPPATGEGGFGSLMEAKKRAQQQRKKK